eukprot:g36352.t1
MNWEIHCLLKTRRAAFKLDDPYDPHKAIRDAKRQYQTKLDAQTNHMDTRCLWQGLINIMGYKVKYSKIADKTAALPDALNAFYAQVEQMSATHCHPTALDVPVPSVTAADVRSVFLRASPRKATNPDEVPGHAVRSRVDQLVVIFTDIFNHSLIQAEVHTCFKKTTIIPQLDPQLPDPQIAISEDRQLHLFHNNPQQGCVLSPLLYSMYTQDCVAKFRMNAIYKFADDTTM